MNAKSKVILQSVILENSRNINRLISLANLRETIAPYSSTPLQISKNLASHSKAINTLIISYRTPPPILNCAVLQSAMMVMSQELSDQVFLRQVERSVRFVDDCLREMNQNDIQENSLRRTLIDFRNCMEGTVSRCSELGVVPIKSQILDLIL